MRAQIKNYLYFCIYNNYNGRTCKYIVSPHSFHIFNDSAFDTAFYKFVYAFKIFF